MARGKAHNEDTKARAVAALMSGARVSDVAREFKVAESTVRSWGESAGVDFAEVRAEKKEALADLVADYLRENLLTLAAQSIIARDGDYIKKYSPESLAILHGVMADKAVRILEAHAAAQPLEAASESQ